ncbi:MAG: anti-sigma factor family protein [Planctomycetota bacterium]|jgi:hypothetical protein
MKEDCERMKDRMADHLFGRLSEHDRDALNEHVAQCSKCAEYFQTLRDEKALLREFAEKVDAGVQRRKEAMAEAIRRCNPSERSGILSPATRLAAAALVFIAVGFVAGRLMPSRPVDIEQLRTALESSLKSSLEEGIHTSLIEQVSRDRESALERHYVRLKDELARQSRHEMSELAEVTLAASQTATEQRLAELIRLIEAARTVDHWQIARAFEQMESNRLQDRTRFGESLVSLASLKNDMMPDDPE